MNPYLTTDEVEIDLLDLGRYLLRRIGWILLVGIVCAGIAAAYKYHSLSDPKAIREAETEFEHNLLMYEQESELIDSSSNTTIGLIQEQEEYLSTSPYMQLDPYQVWKGQTLVQVVSHSNDVPAYQLEELYRYALTSGTYLSDLAQKRETRQVYLRELIDVKSILTSTDLGNTSDVILHEDADDDRMTSRVFIVQTSGSSREEAVELMDVVLAELEAKQEEYKKEYPHDITVLARFCSQMIDSEIRNKQVDNMSYSQTLLTKQKDNDTQKTQLTKPTEGAAFETAAGKISAKDLVMFAVLGFVVGFLLMCVWFAFRYMRNDKLVDYKDISRKGVNLKELGSISDQGIAMVAANVRNFAADRRKIFLTGMTGEAEFSAACASLKEYLAEYEISYLRDVLHDPKSREMLLDCDAAVLVEQKGVTSYRDMKGEITFLVNAEKDIIGIVIV